MDTNVIKGFLFSIGPLSNDLNQSPGEVRAATAAGPAAVGGEHPTAHAGGSDPSTGSGAAPRDPKRGQGSYHVPIPSQRGPREHPAPNVLQPGSQISHLAS